MGVRADVDQVGIDVEPRTGLAYAAFQDVRNSQCMSNLAHVPVAAILHHAGAADHFESGNVRQLGYEIILNTIRERCVFSVVTEIFKRQHSDSCGWLASHRSDLPDDYAKARCQSDGQGDHSSRERIALSPFFSTSKDPGASSFDRLMF